MIRLHDYYYYPFNIKTLVKKDNNTQNTLMTLRLEQHALNKCLKNDIDMC